MIKVETPNLNTVIAQLRAKQKELQMKNGELIDKIVEKGNQKLSDKLSVAEYDGEMKASVAPVEYDPAEQSVSIGIAGSAVTFIEFGTGTFYPDNHPMMDEFEFKRGTFGKGLGANPPWYFRATNGAIGKNAIGEVDAVTASGAVIIKTYGNPANRVVYNTAKELREELKDIAKEVYSK